MRELFDLCRVTVEGDKLVAAKSDPDEIHFVGLLRDVYSLGFVEALYENGDGSARKRVEHFRGVLRELGGIDGINDIPATDTREYSYNVATYGLLRISQFWRARSLGRLNEVGSLLMFERIADAHCEVLGGWVRSLSVGLAKTEVARDRANRRYAKDPKQAEKRFVYSCWLGWHEGKTIYSGKAAFARDMLNKCEHLVSQKQIEDWCREWEKL